MLMIIFLFNNKELHTAVRFKREAGYNVNSLLKDITMEATTYLSPLPFYTMKNRNP